MKSAQDAGFSTSKIGTAQEWALDSWSHSFWIHTSLICCDIRLGLPCLIGNLLVEVLLLLIEHQQLLPQPYDGFFGRIGVVPPPEEEGCPARHAWHAGSGGVVQGLIGVCGRSRCSGLAGLYW